MEAIFMNSENNITPDLHTQSFRKKNLRRSDKYVVLSNLSSYYTVENLKELYKNNKFNKHQHKMIYLTDHISQQIFKIISRI